MVKKLFKHEAHAMWRSMLPFWGVLCGVSLLGRLIQLFEQDNVAYNIVSSSAFFFYGVSVVACLVSPFVFAITRFYRNLFTGEGYLSFTLPVTTHQHIWVKLATAVLTEVVTLVVAVLSVAVITFGEVAVEVCKGIVFLFGKAVEAWGTHMPLYLLEAVIGIVVLFATETLLFYTCISLGQQSKKNRVLAAVGVYFIIYFIGQAVGTVLVLIASHVDWEPLMTWVAEHAFATVHIGMCGGIVLATVMGCVFYWISHRLISTRLNLE